MRFFFDKNKEELVIQDASRIEYNQLELWLTRFVKGYKFTQPYKLGFWNGKQSYFRNGKINMGLWKECFKASKEIGAKFEIENKQDFPVNRDIEFEDFKSFVDDYFKHHKIKVGEEWQKFTPYEHQVETAFKILKNRFCIAEVATSGGKSLIISLIIFWTLKKINKDAKFLIIVPSITLVTQFHDDILINNFGMNKLENMRSAKIDSVLNDNDDVVPCDVRINEIMSDKPRLYSGDKDANIYIGTWQSIEKYPKEFIRQFHTICCDEAHGAKSKTMLEILKKSIGFAYSRFGVSGTFPTDESCEILTIQSVLGPKISEVTADYLKNKGIITQMYIKVLVLDHNNPNIDKMLKDIRKSGDGRNALDIEKKLVHESDKRLEFIKKLVEKCNQNTLLLFHTIEYGQKIFNKLSSELADKDFYYIDGSVSNKKREEIKKQMEITDGKPKILISSFGTLSTGVSIRAIFNIIFVDSFKSEQIVIQSIGRGLRLHPDKDKVNIFDLVDVFDNSKDRPGNILWKHFKEREDFYIKRKYPYKKIKITL